MPVYRDVNTFSGLPAAGCCPLESDVTSEGGQEAESEPVSGRAALSVQPAGPRRQAVAGGTGTGSSEPVAETQPGRFDAAGALPRCGLQVGARISLGWGPQRPRLAWMTRMSDWGVLSWILRLYSFHFPQIPS